MNAVIVSLYKKGGGEKNQTVQTSGITLLSSACNILARVLLNTLIPTIAQENKRKSKCGFRSNRETTNKIFVLRHIQKKCREQIMGLYAAFVDLTKAFDTVSHNGL